MDFLAWELPGWTKQQIPSFIRIQSSHFLLASVNGKRLDTVLFRLLEKVLGKFLYDIL